VLEKQRGEKACLCVFLPLTKTPKQNMEKEKHKLNQWSSREEIGQEEEMAQRT
jgi:hypothetical protein